jgi:cell division protein FtsN
VEEGFKMLNSQRGGIISTIFVIPIGVALMVGIFFLGYYVGKYRSKGVPDEIVAPLPEVVSENLPKSSDFTFFKTLTDKENRTISIELKPRKESEPVSAENKGTAPDQKDKSTQAKRESQTERNSGKPAVASNEPAAKPSAATKEPVITRGPNPKLRYTLQLAAYQEREMAEADVKKMKQLGYSAFIASSELEGKGRWYRVRLGSFSSRASAEKLQKELRAKEGVTPFITLE